MLDLSSNAVRPASKSYEWSTIATGTHHFARRSTTSDAKLAITKRSSSSGLTPTQIGGIFVGCFVFVLLVLLLWLFVARHRYSYRPRPDSPSPSPPPPPPPPPPAVPSGRGPRRPGGGRNPGGIAAPPPPPVPPEPVHAGPTGRRGVTRPAEDVALGYYQDDRRGRRGGWTRPRFRRDDDEDEGGPIFTWSKKSKSRGKSRGARVQVVEPA